MFLADYNKLVKNLLGDKEPSKYQESRISILYSRNISNSLSDKEIENELKKILHIKNETKMEKLLNFSEYLKLNEDGDCGGGSGTAMVTGNLNGMGNIVAPQPGSIPGSVSQNGSGTIGSGDIPARNTDNETIKKKNKKKIKPSFKLSSVPKFNNWLKK